LVTGSDPAIHWQDVCNQLHRLNSSDAVSHLFLKNLLPKYVDNLEQFIEQESLRLVLHELEERIGYAIDPHQFDYLEKKSTEEL
jgi:hypothetical protein